MLGQEGFAPSRETQRAFEMRGPKASTAGPRASSGIASGVKLPRPAQELYPESDRIRARNAGQIGTHTEHRIVAAQFNDVAVVYRQYVGVSEKSSRASSLPCTSGSHCVGIGAGHHQSQWLGLVRPVPAGRPAASWNSNGMGAYGRTPTCRCPAPAGESRVETGALFEQHNWALGTLSAPPSRRPKFRQRPFRLAQLATIRARPVGRCLRSRRRRRSGLAASHAR